MKPNKNRIFIVSILISFFSCYTLYKLYETSLIVLESYPDIDNVAAVGLAMVFAPFMLGMFTIVFYLTVYVNSIKKFPEQSFSWKILLLHKNSWGLNLIRILLYITCIWMITDLIGSAPTWVSLTLVVNIIIYGYWVLQMLQERILIKRSSIIAK
ncbi:hypothetical protein ACERII_03745 [Evansella sp. AB-rgal1]|uniref:hypothetical protein n=1 Tax=Evansella sp. AB-rgal1 TaxID=3242696 RepID=UPI00359DA079